MLLGSKRKWLDIIQFECIAGWCYLASTVCSGPMIDSDGRIGD